MNFEIGVSNVLFYAYHGVDEFEHEIGNEFKITLTVRLPYNENLEKDDLNHTVSYADLYQIILEEIQIPGKLLEKLALRIVKKLRLHFPQVVSGTLKIEKVHPPIPGMLGSAFVVLNF